MPTMYELSKRQQKELLERHRELHIAIPQPTVMPTDLVAFVRQMLPEVARHPITAEAGTVRVAPHKAGEGGLTGIIGGIIWDDDKAWSVAVSVIVAHIAPLGRSAGTTPKVQWPAVVIHDGERIAAGRDNDAS